jgi:VIT1/CCC1 family predicted Fe2+/Mn2+ transporter
MGDSIQARLFSFDNKAWNNPWFAYLGAPVLAMLGVSIGYLFGVHFVNSTLGEYLIVVLCMAITMGIGFVGLASIDLRN